MMFDLKELKEIAVEFPPDKNKISKYIRQNLDIQSLCWTEKESILFAVIEHAYLMNICDICDLVDEDMSDFEFDEQCGKCNHEEKLKLLNTDGRYAPEIVRLILDELDIVGDSTIRSDQCWLAVLYSTFDSYTEEIAKTLLEYGILPENLEKVLEWFYVRADYMSTYNNEALLHTYMNVIKMLEQNQD